MGWDASGRPLCKCNAIMHYWIDGLTTCKVCKVLSYQTCRRQTSWRRLSSQSIYHGKIKLHDPNMRKLYSDMSSLISRLSVCMFQRPRANMNRTEQLRPSRQSRASRVSLTNHLHLSAVSTRYNTKSKFWSEAKGWFPLLARARCPPLSLSRTRDSLSCSNPSRISPRTGR